MQVLMVPLDLRIYWFTWCQRKWWDRWIRIDMNQAFSCLLLCCTSQHWLDESRPVLLALLRRNLLTLVLPRQVDKQTNSTNVVSHNFFLCWLNHLDDKIAVEIAYFPVDPTSSIPTSFRAFSKTLWVVGELFIFGESSQINSPTNGFTMFMCQTHSMLTNRCYPIFTYRSMPPPD